MSLARRACAVALIGVSTAPLPACGDDGGDGAGGDDGLYRPSKNGVRAAESTACTQLTSALESARTRLSCTMTLPTCPSLVRSRSGGEACMQYDDGTIQGCATYYRESADCEELRERYDRCVFAAIAGSAPAGCD